MIHQVALQIVCSLFLYGPMLYCILVPVLCTRYVLAYVPTYIKPNLAGIKNSRLSEQMGAFPIGLYILHTVLQFEKYCNLQCLRGNKITLLLFKIYFQNLLYLFWIMYPTIPSWVRYPKKIFRSLLMDSLLFISDIV